MKRVELEAMAAAELERQQRYCYRFLCCCSTPCLSSGAEIVYVQPCVRKSPVSLQEPN